MDARPSPTPRIVVVVPVGALDGAKSRLGDRLDAEERRDLVVHMLERTVAAALRAPGVTETIVITPDADVRRIALELGARPIRQRSQGLNTGLREARDEAIAAGAEALLVLPVDLPLVSRDAIAATLSAADATARPLVVLVPDRLGRGTNALLLAPPDAIDFAFGGDSRAAHAQRAAAAGARYVELEGPLTLDLDTPDDLLQVEQLPPEVVDAR
jgi:2-phospho-L-lactate/phosphoenolpyruvate guanylyltransferase